MNYSHYAKIPIDLSSVESMQDYYENHSPREMTNKIRSIEASKGLKSPMLDSRLACEILRCRFQLWTKGYQGYF